MSILVPKRHQIKHLGFSLRWFGTRRSVVQIHSPRPLFSFRVNILPAKFALCL